MLRFLEPCDLEIWRTTLKNNGAPLLSIIKLYASFHHHMWIQTRVTVRKQLSWVLTFVTLTFCMDDTFVIGNNSLKFHDDTMMGTWWKRCDGRTDRRTDGMNQSYSCLVAAKNTTKFYSQFRWLSWFRIPFHFSRWLHWKWQKRSKMYRGISSVRI